MCFLLCFCFSSLFFSLLIACLSRASCPFHVVSLGHPSARYDVIFNLHLSHSHTTYYSRTHIPPQLFSLSPPQFPSSPMFHSLNPHPLPKPSWWRTLLGLLALSIHLHLTRIHTYIRSRLASPPNILALTMYHY